jgi:hypothetical protein
MSLTSDCAMTQRRLQTTLRGARQFLVTVSDDRDLCLKSEGGRRAGRLAGVAY